MDVYKINLVGALVLDEAFGKTFIEIFKEQKTFENDIELNIIFNMIYEFYMQYNKVPTIEILHTELISMYDNEELEGITPDFIYRVKLNPEAYDKELYTDVAKELLQADIMEDIQDEGVIKRVEDYNAIKGLNTRVSMKSAFSGGFRANLSKIKRSPLGISFIDIATGGGVLPGESCGFIIPTKGGKTTLVYQASQACVLRQKHCMAFTFEQAFEGNVANRIYCLASQSNMSDWSDPDNVDPAILQRLNESEEAWEKYFRIVDEWTDPRKPMKNISEIFDMVGDRNKELPTGEYVDSIFIDWWGALKYKLIATNSSKGEAHMRTLVQTWLQSIKTYSEQYKVKTYVFHQLAGSKASQKKIATVHDAQEDKNWPQFFDFCFISSKKDEYNIVTFDMQASRSSEGGKFKQFLDGNACLFRDAEAYDMEISNMVENKEENEDAFTEVYNL